MTAFAPEPDVTRTDDGDDLAHASCRCSLQLALCGLDLTGWEQLSDDEADPPPDACVVCLDLSTRPCPQCGVPPIKYKDPE